MHSLTEQFTIWGTCACCLIAHAWDCPMFYNFAIGLTLGAVVVSLLKIWAIGRKIVKDEDFSNPWNPFPTVWVDVIKDFELVEVIIQSDPYQVYQAKVTSTFKWQGLNVILFTLTDKCFQYEKGVAVDTRFDQIIAWRYPS